MATRDIKDAVPLLQKAWEHLENEWPKRHPHEPTPFLTCVYRSNEEQEALFMQGRIHLYTLADVNKARKKVELAPITEKENRNIVTKAKPGQSKHNTLPSRAIDIAFKTKAGKADWSYHLFDKAWLIMKEVSGLKWGGNFPSVDKPHVEV